MWKYGIQLWPSPLTNTNVVDEKSSLSFLWKDTPEPSSVEIVISGCDPCNLAHNTGPDGIDFIRKTVIATAAIYPSCRARALNESRAQRTKKVALRRTSSLKVQEVPRISRKILPTKMAPMVAPAIFAACSHPTRRPRRARLV